LAELAYLIVIAAGEASSSWLAGTCLQWRMSPSHGVRTPDLFHYWVTL